MSDMKATVDQTNNGFHVAGYEKIEYDFEFLDGVFEPENGQLADCYRKWGRCLAVMDYNIFNQYGDQLQAYFDSHKLDLKVHKTMIGEKAKSIDTFLSIVDSMNAFGIYRKVSSRLPACPRSARARARARARADFPATQEPVLVVGGGLVTDVAG